MSGRAGRIELTRPRGNSATLIAAGQPDRQIALPHRSDAECLADELRRLDADEVYAEALVKGLAKAHPAALARDRTAGTAVADKFLA